MWRAATEQDLDWIDAFLRSHVQSSMFLLSNLRDFGLGSDAPFGLNLWVQEAKGQQNPAVFGITNSGTLLMQMPDADNAIRQTALDLITGYSVSAILGDAPQVRSLAKLAGLDTQAMQLDDTQLGFHLDLKAMNVPARASDQLVPFTQVDRSLLENWRAASSCETLGMTPDHAKETAKKEVARYTAEDTHRVLLVDGQPVSMTGFNSRIPGVVQIGGVFTPPELRGQGHARHAVALHLAEAREADATQAVLFAANEAAATAYRAIGFKEAGKYALMLFREAQVIRTANVEART